MVEPIPLILLSAATLPPLLLAPTGGDHHLRIVSQEHLGGSYYPEPISVGAPYVVAAGALGTWTVAALADACEWQKAPTAMMQGMAWTLAVVTLSKWARGRQWPNAGGDPTAPDRLDHPDYAVAFEPFSSVDRAFPSGHTGLMFAAAAALRTSSPELGTWRYLGYPLAAGVGFGMWYGDHHWTSDILSGALMGEALGGAAGRAWDDGEQPQAAWLVLPLPRGGAVAWSGTL